MRLSTFHILFLLTLLGSSCSKHPNIREIDESARAAILKTRALLDTNDLLPCSWQYAISGNYVEKAEAAAMIEMYSKRRKLWYIILPSLTKCVQSGEAGAVQKRAAHQYAIVDFSRSLDAPEVSYEILSKQTWADVDPNNDFGNVITKDTIFEIAACILSKYVSQVENTQLCLVINQEIADQSIITRFRNEGYTIGPPFDGDEARVFDLDAITRIEDGSILMWFKDYISSPNIIGGRHAGYRLELARQNNELHVADKVLIWQQ